MDLFFVQFFLGVVLFFIINWIGKHSYSIGYMEISIFVKKEEAPALNFAIRVFTPIVYLIIISTALYYFALDRFVKNIFLVNCYYIFFRLAFNLLTGRALLLNWYRQFLYWGAILVISYFTYDKIIREKTNILIDFTTLANELWIIILIFLFQVANNIRLSEGGTVKRKENYLKSRYNYFKKIYGKTISEIAQNEVLEAITYTILIYEDFNRPKIARLVENAKFRLTKKTHTLGVMQVKSDILIDDYESIVIGTNKIVSAYKSYIEKNPKVHPDTFEWYACEAIVSDYNIGTSYKYEVVGLFSIIKANFYKNTTDTLMPKKVN